MAVTSRHNKYTSIPDWFSGQSTETATTSSSVSQTVYISGSSSSTTTDSTVDFKDIPIDASTIVWQNELLTVPIDNDKIIIVDGKLTTSLNSDGVWELRLLTDGTNYIYTTYPVVTQLGITMYAGTEGLDIAGIYDGLPIDNTTIYWDIDSNGNKVLKAIGSSSGGGVADSVAWANVIGKPAWLLDNRVSYSEIEGTPDLSKFVTRDLDETITGIKSFINGLKIGESLIKQLQEDVVYIDANLVVRGGVTMYYDNGEIDIPTIKDQIGNAGYNTKGLASFDQNYFIVNDGHVSLIEDAVGLNETELRTYLINNNYAKKSDIPSLNGYATKSYVDSTFVTIVGNEDVTGIHNFVNGIKVGDIVLKKWSNDVVYLDGNLVVKGGISMYADGGTVDIGSLYDGIPVDGVTIIKNNNGLLSLNPNIELGGLDEEELDNYLYTHKYAKLSDIPSLNGYATQQWVLGKNYIDTTTLSSANVASATKLQTARKIWGNSFDGTSDIKGLLNMPNNNAYACADTEGKNRAVMLLSSSNNLNIGYASAAAGYTTRLSGNIVDITYGMARTIGATLDSGGNFGIGTRTPSSKLHVIGDILATTNITTNNTLTINGIVLSKSQDDVLYLDGNLVVRGGVTMYGSDSTFTPSTIMDAIVVDGTTISKDGGVLKVIGGNNGGVADSIAWSNISDKPSWITNSVPVIGISGVNVSLGSGITQTALRTALGLGSNAYSSTEYLPLTGNASSATKLETARTIWGQSFDGTGNIDGKLILNNNIALCGKAIDGTAMNVLQTTTDNNLSIGLDTAAKGYSTYISGNNIYLRYGTSQSVGMLLNSSGNITIGSSDLAGTSCKLYVAGNILATGNATLNQLITTDPTGIRLSYGNCGTLLRSDGDNFYILLTNSGNALNGTWNDLRPFRISLSTGDITMESNLSVTKYFAIGSRFRVNSAESTNSFGFFKSNIANQSNIGIAHLGTNYGGTTDINRTDLDMTAISMYRGVVGIGKEYDYSSIRSIYDSGVNLGVPTGVLIGLSKLIYKDSILGISSETSIGQTLHVYSSGTNFTQGIRVYQNGTGYAGLMLGGADLTTTAGTTARSWFISTNNNDRFSISKGGFEPTDSIAFGYNGQWLVNGGDLVVSSNILATGGITMYSAKKLKNIKDERGLSLEELAIIKPTRYTWKDGRDDRLHIGGIADDVIKVLPEVVYKIDDDTLTMDYGNASFAIAASLIKPVISHEERIKTLEEENKRLKEDIEQLKQNVV